MDDLEKKYPRIYHRHFRKVMSHPEGAIAHDGDCGIWRLFRICTCGLHHELMCMPDEAAKIYPKYWDEQEGLAKIDMLMNEEEQMGLWVGCYECKGEGGIGDIPCDECEGKGVVPFKMPDPPTEAEIEERMKMIQDMFQPKEDKEKFPEK